MVVSWKSSLDEIDEEEVKASGSKRVLKDEGPKDSGVGRLPLPTNAVSSLAMRAGDVQKKCNCFIFVAAAGLGR